MLINGTFLRLSHSLETRSKLKKPSLCALKSMRAATPSSFSSSSAKCWYMTHPFICTPHLFLHSRGKRQVDQYGIDFSGHSSFPMNIFALNCLPFFNEQIITLQLSNLKGRNFRGKKISRISRIQAKFAKINSFFDPRKCRFAKINSREIFQNR